MFFALLPYLLILLSFGMAIWAKSLYFQINNLPVSSIIEGTVYSFLNSGVEGAQNIDLLRDLVVPGVMLILASSLLLLASYLILKQKMDTPELSLNNILKGAIIALSILMMIPFLYHGGKLLVFTFLFFLTVLLIPIFIIWGLAEQSK